MRITGGLVGHTIYMLFGIIVLTSLLVGITVYDAEAHKVNVFAYIEGDQVVVEGYFSGSVKAQNCQIEVLDSSGKKLLEGKTDVKGVFTFKLKELPPFKGGLKIVLNAEMGHRGEYTIPESDLPRSLKKESSEPQIREDSEQKAQAAQPKSGAPTVGPLHEEWRQKAQVKSASKVTESQTTVAMDEAAFRRTLENMLDQKLAPLVRMIGNQEKILLEQKMGGPRMSDIVGGIGWILGIAGIVAFIWGKKNAKNL